MIAVTYTIELYEPLLATSLDGDPNTKASHNFVPGSLLRGALIYQYLRQKRQDLAATATTQVADAVAPRATIMLDHANSKEYRLFLSDATRYLNAYPLCFPPLTEEVEQRSYRLLPLPKSFQKLKGKKLKKNENFLYNTTALQYQRPVDQLTGVGDEFCLPTAETILVHTPLRQLAVHTQRERTRGRATEADGAIFQYDALAPGQKFAGHILTTTKDDAEELVKLLNSAGELWLGGSRSGGYGHVSIEAWQEDDWQSELQWFTQDDEEAGVPIWEGTLSKGDTFSVTLLSPCLLRDQQGMPSADLQSTLADLLGISGQELQPDWAHTRRSMTLVGGFNRTWGLPLPQMQALAAGSVFTFTLATDVDHKLVTDLIDAGIGEQRMDGLGRIAINWLSNASYDVDPLQTRRKPPVDAPPIAAIHQPIAKAIGERILRRELEQKLTIAVSNLQLHHQSYDKITKSQLSRLRVLLREQLGWWQQQPIVDLEEQALQQQVDECVTPLVDYFNQLKRPAQKQFEQARIGSNSDPKRLGVWIRAQLALCQQHDQPVWPDYLVPTKTVSLGGAIVTPPSWRTEYTLRLIDGVLAQAAKAIDKHNQNKQGGDDE